MVERNTFVDVSDGDQLSEGYFNGIGIKFDEVINSTIFKIDSAVGLSTSSTSEVELDTITLPAGTFGVDDIIEIVIIGGNNEAQNANFKVRVNDGTNTFTSGGNVLSASGKPASILKVSIYQSPPTNTLLVAKLFSNLETTAFTISSASATLIANFMASELTISLRGNVTISGTLTARWAIFRRKIT